MPKLNLDFETRSRCDIFSCGAYRYSEDPSTEVLVLAVAKDGGPVVSWDASREPNDAYFLLLQAIEEKWEIHAFNSQFEWAILKYVTPRQFNFPVPDINTIRCTRALCLRGALPAPKSLAKTAAYLQVPAQKAAVGKALIHKFSVPQKNGEFLSWNSDEEFTLDGKRTTAREAFKLFVDYCEKDVAAEMAVAHAMRCFELKGAPLDSFLVTARINDRGIPVDVEALERADEIRLLHEKRLGEEYREITGLSPNQNAKSLAWVQAEGYGGSSLNKESRERFGDSPGLSERAKRALEIKGRLSYAAVKKVPAIRNWAMSDNHVRGSFLWCGAQKTWRWTSEGVQWQNMKKPPKPLRKNIEIIYQGIRKGWDRETLSEHFGDPYELIACLARYFVRFPDCGVYDTDYASVEARILPFLIGAERILAKIRSGEDIYTGTGTALAMELKEKFDVPFAINRDTAKTVVLAVQFQGGWHAVYTATGNKWERKWCEAAAKIVRQENPEFKEAWKAFQDTFVKALDCPHQWFNATEHVAFAYIVKKPYPRMLMRLPSGRAIVYPYPKKEPITMVQIGGKEGSFETQWEQRKGHFGGVGDAMEIIGSFKTWEISYEGHVKGVQYGRVKTYGGDLLQSATQGTGVDLLAHGAIEAEKAGFDPFFLVHDQCLTPARGDMEKLTRALCKIPEWFKGFPLEATTERERSYCKS